MILFPIYIPCTTYKHVNTTESSLHSLCSYHCTTHYRKMSAESAIIKITIIRPTLNAQTQRHAHTKCANNLQYVSVKKKKKTQRILVIYHLKSDLCCKLHNLGLRK